MPLAPEREDDDLDGDVEEVEEVEVEEVEEPETETDSE